MPRFSPFFILLFFLLSCSSGDLKRRNLDEYFVGSGVVRYFLPNIPLWANYSGSGKCHRVSQKRFFNHEKIRNSFSLTYEEAVQFQYMFNVESHRLRKEFKVDYLPFKEEEKLFYQLKDKIDAGVRQFMSPEYNRIHLVWIDEAIRNPAKMKALKKLLKGDQMNRGYPVLVSLCLSADLIENLLVKESLSTSLKYLTYEVFSPFDLEKVLKPGSRLYFGKLFSKDQKLIFYLPSKKLPAEFIGQFDVRYY